MEKTANDILIEAAQLLSEEGRWTKGSFFKKNGEHECSMCAHGAIAYCGSAEVKQNIAMMDLKPDARSINAAMDMLYNWEHQYDQEEYLLKHNGPLAVAHFKAARVGLNYQFNDDQNTSKQEVIDKLLEAAAS